jgi:hypothetical protein
LNFTTYFASPRYFDIPLENPLLFLKGKTPDKTQHLHVSQATMMAAKQAWVSFKRITFTAYLLREARKSSLEILCISSISLA